MAASERSPAGPGALLELRAAVARLERGAAAAHRPGVSLCPPIDAALPGGGLARAAFHEVLSGAPGATTAFCGLVLARAAGPVVWIADDPDIWPAGLAEFGLSPADLVVVAAPRPKDGFWAFEEALRSRGVAGAVLVLGGPAPDLAAARRFQLAAETGAGIGLLVTPDTDRMSPSAARTRWRVGSAITPRVGSATTPQAGHPSWHLTLLRAAGGRPAAWTVTWDRDARALAPVQTPRMRHEAAVAS